MNKEQIITNLEIIKAKIASLTIRGGDAILMADALVGIDQTIQLVKEEGNATDEER